MANIAQSLKEKNRITGRISKLQTQVRTYNRYDKANPPDLSGKDLLIKLQEEWAYLIDLKTKIAKANIGIANKLIRLTEAKAELKFWTELQPYTGKEWEVIIKSVYKSGGPVDVQVEMVSDITSLKVLEQIEHVQLEIEMLQDDIDSYNAQTQI